MPRTKNIKKYKKAAVHWSAARNEERPSSCGKSGRQPLVVFLPPKRRPRRRLFSVSVLGVEDMGSCPGRTAPPNRRPALPRPVPSRPAPPRLALPRSAPPRLAPPGRAPSGPAVPRPAQGMSGFLNSASPEQTLDQRVFGRLPATVFQANSGKHSVPKFVVHKPFSYRPLIAQHIAVICSLLVCRITPWAKCGGAEHGRAGGWGGAWPGGAGWRRGGVVCPGHNYSSLTSWAPRTTILDGPRKHYQRKSH